LKWPHLAGFEVATEAPVPTFGLFLRKLDSRRLALSQAIALAGDYGNVGVTQEAIEQLPRSSSSRRRALCCTGANERLLVIPLRDHLKENDSPLTSSRERRGTEFFVNQQLRHLDSAPKVFP
jgi:hypothetical protein